MTKRKRIFISILTKLLAASSARISAALPIALLTVFLSFSLSTAMQAAERDSLYTFQFVSGRGMFYVPYKGNGAELERLLVLIRQHQKDILAGNIPVFVNGFCQSASTGEENRHLARERSNRVKTEIILRGGLREDCFHTTNFTGTSGETGDMVFVRIALPEDRIVSDLQTAGEEILPSAPLDNATECNNSQSKGQLDDAKGQLGNAKGQLDDAKADLYDSDSNAAAPLHTWTIGLNIGIPFFWGDMLSMSADKTYIGISAGLQASYRFSDFLGVSLSADYAQGRTGARGYAQDYQLSPSGMTFYTGEAKTLLPYETLYSKISVLNTGFGIDIHLNRFFGRSAVSTRFQAILTPTVYGQFFSADLYNKVNNARFSDGTTKPNTLSIGLGGALGLQYHFTPSLGIQFKNSLIWITDNQFDGIATPYNHTLQNAMWLSQVGIIWYFLHR